MKTKNIFKALALAMLLTTACVNNEIPNENGYALPVTVNVTRQGNDPATRATYNDGTHELGFSTGDKLFVKGQDGGKSGVGDFAGTLDMVSDGVFSGTIYTERLYSGTADALFTTAASSGYARATLLPAGYGSKGYFTHTNPGTYNEEVTVHSGVTFSTSKAEAIEQFSYEYADTYSGSFALSPQNAILDFTITGLTPSATVNVSLAESFENTISGTVTTNAAGTATFVMAKYTGNLGGCTLTVGGDVITIVSASPATPLTRGKIYNIYRDKTIPRVDLSTISGDYNVTKNVILTGTPAADLTISNDGGYTVTLDNVNPEGTATVRMNCNSDFTLKLKGTSKFTRILDIGRALTISEAVAGGTVIINNNSTGYALRAATVTVNGGTVKAKAQNNAVNGNLAVNGGAVYLEGGDSVYSAVTGTITGSLYGWNGSSWGSSGSTSDKQYISTDNITAPSSWTW